MDSSGSLTTSIIGIVFLTFFSSLPLTAAENSLRLFRYPPPLPVLMGDDELPSLASNFGAYTLIAWSLL